jgi:hypothetical protein
MTDVASTTPTLTLLPANLTVDLAAGPPSTAVEFLVTYEDGTAGTSLSATTDDTGAASVTFSPTSASTATVTAVAVIATATS